MIDYKQKIEDWIIRNVDESVIPDDRRNGYALKYNLIHLLRGDGNEYSYKLEQEAELQALHNKYGIDYEYGYDDVIDYEDVYYD